ncbi:MAG TPA: serine/threonine-protein kinase [Gemmataceae bacterium]|nr:serine/threonine-protein kinase [Gemmataceae bacterium]
MIGERVGDWVIEAELGRDHKGRAYRAHAAADPARLATVKILTGPTSQSSEFHNLFRGRLAVLLKLTHPNIVAYLGGGVVHDNPYFVAEHVPGPDHQALLRQGKRPVWTEVLAFALQIVSALRHAHRRGVLHGDLKPGNLLLAPDGKVKLAECGIARVFGAEVPPPGDNPLSSAAFISPEQAAGKPATKRSDFYSLGCLLYALLTGRAPFIAANVVELIHKHCFVMPERPAHFLSDLPDEFDALVMKLLSKDPQNRPGSGTLLLAEFERLWASLEARGRLSKRPALPPDDPLPPPADEEEKPPTRAVLPEKLPRPLMSRPFVVIPLFVMVVGLLIGGFYLSRTDPDDLWAKAQPLMQSDDPGDWEKAWTEYLEPLSREYPDRYADEIKAFRAQTDPQAELRRAQAAGRAVKYASEAERFFHEGMQLARAGDFAAARRVWERTAIAFGGVPSEARWVDLCRLAAARAPTTEGALRRPATAAGIRATSERARSLRAEGKTAEADAVWDALENLYRDDPDAAEIRELIRKDRAP